MVCSKCGKESIEGALYCEWCGTEMDSVIKKNDKYIIYNSKKKNLVLIFISLLMVGNSVFVIFMSNDELAKSHLYGATRIVAGHPLLIKLIAWVCLILFGVGLILFLSGRYLKKPCLILDSEGIYIGVNYLGGFRGKLSWEEIIEISVSKIMKQKALKIDFIPTQRKSTFKRKYSIVQKIKNGTKTAYLPLVTMKEDEKVIMEQIYKYERKYKPRYR